MTGEERMDAIRRALNATFTITNLEVSDDSHLHIDHVSHGGAGHFTIRLVSDDFKNMARVKRHQMIYSALNDLMGEEIHALAIETKTTDERKNER